MTLKLRFFLPQDAVSAMASLPDQNKRSGHFGKTLAVM